MKSHKIITAFILIAIILISACKKDEDNNLITISVEQETDILENSFTVNWLVNTSDILKVTIEISKEKDLNTGIVLVNVANTTQTSQKIEELDGATTYYYKIIVELVNGNKLVSNINSVTTGYENVAVKITTSDGIKLAGKLKYLAGNEIKKPGIIFMHELRALGNNWNDAELVTNLIARGYVCLILDFRGHFLSDYVPLPTEQSEV